MPANIAFGTGFRWLFLTPFVLSLSMDECSPFVIPAQAGIQTHGYSDSEQELYMFSFLPNPKHCRSGPCPRIAFRDRSYNEVFKS